MHKQPTKHTKATNQSDLTDKKAYHTPKLSSFGNMADLTQTNAPPPFTGNDGGSFPNNYGS